MCCLSPGIYNNCVQTICSYPLRKPSALKCHLQISIFWHLFNVPCPHYLFSRNWSLDMKEYLIVGWRLSLSLSLGIYIVDLSNISLALSPLYSFPLLRSKEYQEKCSEILLSEHTLFHRRKLLSSASIQTEEFANQVGLAVVMCYFS